MENRPTRESYSHVIADKNLERKHKEAEERQALRKQRTNKQQIAKLDTEGWGAKKERARLKA